MQGNRITMLSSSETYHIGSSSDNSTMDQHNLLHNHLESQSFPHHCLLNAGDTEMQNGNMIGQQNVSLNVWNSSGSSSVECLANEDGCFEAKGEHFGPSSLAVRGALRIEGRRSEGRSSLPSQNLNLDLNLNQVDHAGAENVGVIGHNLQSGLSIFPANRGLFPAENVSPPGNSSDAIASSSRTVNLLDHGSGQHVSVLDGRHSSCKRKNVDGIPVQSSAGGSSSNLHHSKNRLLPLPTHESIANLNIPTSNFTSPYPPVDDVHHSTGLITSPVSSENCLFSSDPPATANFLRSTRMRVNPSENDLTLPNLLPDDSAEHSSYQPTQRQASSFIPVHQLTQPRVFTAASSSHNGPAMPIVTNFSQNLHRGPPHGNFGPRIGGASISADIVGDRPTPPQPNRRFIRSSLPEHFLFANASNVVHDSTNLHLASGSRSTVQSPSSAFRGAVNAGSQEMLGSNMVSQQSSVRGFSEVVHRSLLSAGVPQSRNPSIIRGHSSTSHEIRSHQPGASSRVHQQPHLRAAPSIERQNSSHMDVPSFVRSIAASRGGSRVLSELRSVFDQIQLGGNARLEDLLLIDRSVIFRRANLIDRHRDMRLDVDNMSYEELLALGERIGYVNTGLSEDKIISGLMQRRYVSIAAGPPTGVEPCCICQEDYVEGDELGGLDCGHDFHTDCIKKWLMIKNLCPICKKTALGT